MADPTVRLMRLLTLLQQRAAWAGPDLAERLGVSTRGVRRDIERLRRLGYPVESERGAGGGYRLVAGRAMPPLVLDDDEAVAIAVSLRVAAGGTVAGMEETAVRALAKLDQVVPARLRERIDAVRMATVRADSGVVAVDAEVLTALARACRDTVQVRFAYTRADGSEAGERRVEPYRLVTTDRRWYLFAWDLDRDDWRVFRLDRMGEVRATTWRFTPRDAPDAAEHVARGTSRDAYPHLVRLRVHAPATAVRQVYPPTTADVRPDPSALDGASCLVDVGAMDLDHAARHLAWLPWALEVLGPPEAADAVRALADRLAEAARFDR